MRHGLVSGFTLPEVLMAVLLLAVGMTALASTATALARAASEAREITAAAALAGATLDSLRVAPCRSIAPGSTGLGSPAVRWTIRPETLSVHVLASVEVRRGPAVRTWALETLIPCDR